MPLPFKVKAKEQIPADHAALYVERTLTIGGKSETWFVLDATGAEPEERLQEFRDNNVKLLKDAEKFKDIDPEKYKKLMADHAAAEHERLKKEGKLEEAHAAQVDALKNSHKQEVEKAGVRVTELTERLSKVLIDDAVATKATEKGVKPTAIIDVKSRARAVFKMEGDKVVAMNGEKPAFNTKGDPLSIADWLDTLSAEAPHLFEESKGSGGGDRNQGNTNGEVNPYSKATWNLTKQAALTRTDPKKAAAMQSAATR